MQQQLTPKMAHIMLEARRLAKLAIEENAATATTPMDELKLYSKAVVFVTVAELFGPDLAAALTAPIIDG